MGIETPQRLHWTQRVALVLQAHAFIDGTNHVAIFHAVLGNEADQVLSTLDNLNAGIAYVHQDAFKAVYDGAKSTMYKADNSPSSRRSLLRVDICQQRDMADHAIDKTANSAIQLIQSQPVQCQDAVANAWITGTTIIADSVSVCLNEMEHIEANMDDFIRLEYSWSCIQSSVDAAVSALRGIFSLMEQSHNLGLPEVSRNLSVSSATGSDAAISFRSRTSSTASAFSIIKRAFSHSHMLSQPVPKISRAGSQPPVDQNSRGLRASVSAACPTRMSNYTDHVPTLLATIPPTPSVHDTPLRDASLSPFLENGDYFAFDMEKESNKLNKTAASPSPSDMMELYENLDPLYSPIDAGLVKKSVPLTLRRLSDAERTSGVLAPPS